MSRTLGPKILLCCAVGLTLAGLSLGSWSQAQQANSAPIQFVDIARSAGLTAVTVNGGEKTKKYIWESTGSGIAATDFDRDGFWDLFVLNGSVLGGFAAGAEPVNHLYRNNHDGTFADVTARAGLDQSGWAHGVCAGDYDNDGFDDLFVTYFGRSNILYRNNGDGTFADRIASAGLKSKSPRNWGAGCAFVDYDRDGKLDLFVAGYVDIDESTAPLPGSGLNCLFKGVAVYCGPRGLPFSMNHLYHNNGDGTFTDVSEAAGIRKAPACYGLGVLTGDFFNRNRQDIYVACDSTPSLLFENNGDGTFTERGIEAGVAYNEDGLEQAGMGISAGDYDGDGYLDILKTSFDDDIPALFHNEKDGHFNFMTYDAKLGSHRNHLSWGGGFLDYDNDGWSDILIANGHVYPELEWQNHPESPYRQPNLLYRNLGNGTFDDVSSSAGPGFKLRHSARGVAFFDLENDGDLDVAINNQNDPPTLLRNDGGNRSHWITIQTVGNKSNRDGIGARVSIVAGGRRQFADVRSGGSYISQSELRVHFGLGDRDRIEQLEVRWPSGMVDKLENVAADRFLVVEEGKGAR